MPKQRPHPHHHSVTERKRRAGGLRLPSPYAQYSRDPWDPRLAPGDWELRSWWRPRSRTMRVAVVAGAIVAAFSLLLIVYNAISQLFAR